MLAMQACKYAVKWHYHYHAELLLEIVGLLSYTRLIGPLYLYISCIVHVLKHVLNILEIVRDERLFRGLFRILYHQTGYIATPKTNIIKKPPLSFKSLPS